MARVNCVNFNQRLGKSLENFSAHGGEKIANYVNAAGKFAVAPLVIMFNPFSNESAENRKWAAIKQPIEAVATIAIQMLALKQLYKGVDKLNEKGLLKFRIVDLAKEKSIFPDKFQKEIKNGMKKSKAITELSQETLGLFKDRLGTLLTIGLYVPVLAITNKIYPIIAGKVIKNESK